MKRLLLLLGLAVAVYHLTNGVATGAAVLGLTPTLAAERRLGRLTGKPWRAIPKTP